MPATAARRLVHVCRRTAKTLVRGKVCRRLGELTGGAGLGQPLTAGEVAAALHVPLSIAGEFLATAEAAAVLCRDDGPEGLRFYRNWFLDGGTATA